MRCRGCRVALGRAVNPGPSPLREPCWDLGLALWVTPGVVFGVRALLGLGCFGETLALPPFRSGFSVVRSSSVGGG